MEPVASEASTVDGSDFGEVAGQDAQPEDVARTEDPLPEDVAADSDTSTVDVIGADATGQQFLCGDVTCTDDASEYCLTFLGGCIVLGGACFTSADCCTNWCLNGICSAAGIDGGVAGDAGSGASYSCAVLPPDCRTSPPTCACVAAHQPCGGVPVLSCTADGGVVDVTCTGA